MNPLLSDSFAYNVWMEAAMLPFLFLLALALYTRYSAIVEEANRWFRVAVVSSFIAAAMGVFSTIMIDGRWLGRVPFVNIMLRTAYYAAVNVNAYCMLRYMESYVRVYDNVLHFVNLFLLCGSFMMLALNLMPRIGGFFFEMSAVPGEYMLLRGPYYTLCRSFCPFYFLLLALYVSFTHRNAYANVRQYALMNVLWGLLIFAFIIQYFFIRYVLIIYVIVTILLFMIFFCYEVPIYRQMAEAKRELESSRVLADISRRFAETATRAKGDFLASMSQEIRTPINDILSMNEMILKESRDGEVRRSALDIRVAGNHLMSIINNILDISKIESGKMELYNDDYHLWQLLVDVQDSVSETFHENGLAFVLDVDKTLPEHLNGDEDRLRQILINLVDNAVKYTRNGSVFLIVRGQKENGTVNLEIAVRDTGIGIRKEDLDHLFQIFERVNLDETQSIKGAGLGLTLVRYLLNLMGGHIKVESEYGEGSTFTITLKQYIARSGFQGTIGAYEERSMNDALKGGGSGDDVFICPNANVLVVDDTPVNLVVAKGMLGRTKANVDTAGGGSECLELMAKNKYDIVFIDHLMPVMDGIETLDKAKALPGVQDTVFIVLTANTGTGLREEYAGYGFDDYLPKPLKFDAIHRALALYLPKELKQKA
jgi:signal transduction histidine kinase/CheY-like chemotaxis protein